MPIQLTTSLFWGGIEYTRGQSIPGLNPAEEAGLVSSNRAFYTSGPFVNNAGVAVESFRNPVTGGVGITAGLPPRQRALAKCPTGFMQASVGYGAYTTNIQTVLEKKSKRIRVHLPNLTVAALAGMKVAVGTSDTLGAVNSHGSKGAGVAFTELAFSEAHAAARLSATRPTWMTSDWLAFETESRADGGALDVLHLRIVGAAGDATWFGGMGVWSDETATQGRVWRGYRSNAAGDYIATPAGFETASTNAVAGHHAVLIEYEVDGHGRTLHVVGDSIYMGTGTGIALAGWSWAALAQCALSDPSMPVELCNMGWSGQNAPTYSQRYLDVVDRLSPGAISVYAAFTPNSFNAPGTSANITTMKTALTAVRSACVEKGNLMVCPTGLPANAASADGGAGLASAKSFGVGDVLRSQYNAELHRLAAYTIDFDGASRGTAVASGTAVGQIEFRTGFTSDGLHPNDTLASVLASEAARVLSPLI